MLFFFDIAVFFYFVKSLEPAIPQLSPAVADVVHQLLHARLLPAQVLVFGAVA